MVQATEDQSKNNFYFFNLIYYNKTQEKQRMNKKGQMRGAILIGAVLLVIALIVFLILGAGLTTIFGGLVTTSVTIGGTNVTTNNTVTAVNETGSRLSVFGVENCDATLVQVQNRTSGANVALANYTESACVIYYAAGDGIWNNTVVNVTYTYTQTTGNTQRAIVNNSLTSYTTISNYIVPLVLLIVAVFFLGLMALIFLLLRNLRAGASFNMGSRSVTDLE